MSPYTIQNCSKCGKNVEIDAFVFLMTLGDPVLCKDCKEKAKEDQPKEENK